ncbi:uncharacterized protein LOC132700422 isoform X1 [Cylas formicarius]|uniref:uncharacterized protein LOC132700422 isoform X1 n=1 Tax=Cylas formicarius TaxID=197179 RepID=UPI002958CFE3|nr:uncharacterized protein LOC132700422 isoform X1 [Cylas formicarius]
MYSSSVGHTVCAKSNCYHFFAKQILVMQRTKSNVSRSNALQRSLSYKIHPSARSNVFESSSLACPNPSKVSPRCFSFRSDAFQNTSTQTRKMAVSRKAKNSPRMSPDSLSPKTEYDPELGRQREPHFSSIGNSESGLFCTSKNRVLNYLYSRKPQLADRGKTLAEGSLTNTFLKKNRTKIEDNACTITATKSRFLQQTSPLRKLTPGSLKSQSFVEPRLALNNKLKLLPVKQKTPSEYTAKPVKYFLNFQGDAISSPKNKSFMSPTISSEQKNKLKEIRDVERLISPTRRGRSASPKANVNMRKNMKKVPYIDKSSSSIFQSGCRPIQSDSERFILNLGTSTSNTSIATALENSCTISGIEQDLSQAIAKLKENDWNIALRGLAEIVEICRVTDSDFVYPHMTSINQRIIDLLKSPRSHVCRTTCQATGHLFEYVKDTRRPEFDEIVDTLLCRTADSNKFIRRDANLALDCMVTHISTLHAVRAICAKGPEHKNFLVRSAAARLIVCAAVIAGPHAILNPNYSDYTRRRIILNMVKFLNDKTYETRKFGQRLYRLLSIDKMFDFYLKRYLERDAVQKIKLCVKMDNVKKL